MSLPSPVKHSFDLAAFGGAASINFVDAINPYITAFAGVLSAVWLATRLYEYGAEKVRSWAIRCRLKHD